MTGYLGSPIVCKRPGFFKHVWQFPVDPWNTQCHLKIFFFFRFCAPTNKLLNPVSFRFQQYSTILAGNSNFSVDPCLEIPRVIWQKIFLAKSMINFVGKAKFPWWPLKYPLSFDDYFLILRVHSKPRTCWNLHNNKLTC